MSGETNVLVAQSGGPTTVINASLAGVIDQVIGTKRIDKIYGSMNGIQGVLNDNLVPLHQIFDNHKERLDLLKVTPSMFLGSCRYKLPSIDSESNDYETIFRIFETYQIRYFFYIGGNDSMDTVAKLSQYAKEHDYDITIMGVPKTIDNDLIGIDHTPGFGSAAKFIASSVLEMAHDTAIYDMESVLIIEIMGRNAGWLTASSALARNNYSNAPHLIYLPERPFSTEQFVEDIKKQLQERKQVIVAVSEGIHDVNGEYVSAKSMKTDQFGHVMLSGTGKYLEGIVQEQIGCKVRSIELNVLQRCAAHIASQTDIDEAFQLGREAVKAALDGHTREMVVLTRVANNPYQVEYSTIDIDQVANHEKKIPQEWINIEGNDVTDAMIEYLKPLVVGEVQHRYQEGMPMYLSIRDFITE